MKFVTNISKDDYISFWKQSNNAHFLNSYEWGILQKDNRNQIPMYVGLVDDDNKIVAETLLLKKKTPFNMCYLYAPRGFMIDWSNKNILNTFTNELKKFLKEENAIYLKVDPDIMYQEVDDEANVIPNGKNNYELFNYLTSIGYTHQGFNKLYEKNQPRYTFRTIFKNYDTFEDVEKTISKTFMRSIKRSYNYDLNITIEKDINDFYELINRISKKDDFKAYSKKYYEELFELNKDTGYIKNFVAKININNLITKLEEQLLNEKNEDRKNKINKDIEFFKNQERKDEYTIASLICIYTEKGAWSLYIGNDDVAEYTGCVNRLYYEFIKDAYNNHLEFADLFGVCGDPKTKYKNLAGIYEYKRKLGGTLIEFIGEFDLINKPFWYKILPILLKIYRKIKG